MKYQSLLAVSMFALCLAFPCHPIYADVQPVVRASDELKLEKTMTLDQVPDRIKNVSDLQKARWLEDLQAAFASDRERLATNTLQDMSAFLEKLRLLGVDHARRLQSFFDWIDACGDFERFSPEALAELDLYLARMKNEPRADEARLKIANTIWEHRLLDKNDLTAATASDIDILSRLADKHQSLDSMESASFEILLKRLLEESSDLGSLSMRSTLGFWQHLQAREMKGISSDFLSAWVLRGNTWQQENPAEVSGLLLRIPHDDVQAHQDARRKLAMHLFEHAVHPQRHWSDPTRFLVNLTIVSRIHQALPPPDRQALLTRIHSIWSEKSSTVATTTFSELMLVVDVIKGLGGSPEQVAMPMTAWLDYPSRWRFIELTQGVELFKRLSESGRPEDAGRMERFVLQQRLEPALAANAERDAAEQLKLLLVTWDDFSKDSNRQAIDAWTRTLANDAARRHALGARQLLNYHRLIQSAEGDASASKRVVALWVQEPKNLNDSNDNDLFTMQTIIKEEDEFADSRSKLVNHIMQKHRLTSQETDVEGLRGFRESVRTMNRWTAFLDDGQKQDFRIGLKAWFENDQNLKALPPVDMDAFLRTTARYFGMNEPQVAQLVSNWMHQGDHWKTANLAQMRSFSRALHALPAQETPPQIAASQRQLTDHAFNAELMSPAFWNHPLEQVAAALQPWAAELSPTQKSQMASHLRTALDDQPQWIQACTINQLLNLDTLLSDLHVDGKIKAGYATQWYANQKAMSDSSMRDLVQLVKLFRSHSEDEQAKTVAATLGRQIWERTAGNADFVNEAELRQIISYRTYYDSDVTNEDLTRSNQLLLARVNHPEQLQATPYEQVRSIISSLRRLRVAGLDQANFAANWVKAHQKQLKEMPLAQLNHLRDLLSNGESEPIARSTSLLTQAALVRFESEIDEAQANLLPALGEIRFFARVMDETQQAQVRNQVASTLASQSSHLTSLDASQMLSLVTMADLFQTQPAQSSQWIVQWFESSKAWLDFGDEATRDGSLRLLARLSQSVGEKHRKIIQTAGDHYYAAYLNNAVFYDHVAAGELYASLYAVRPYLNGQQRRQVGELLHHRLTTSETSEIWPEPLLLSNENGLLWRNYVRLLSQLDRRDLAMDLTRRSLDHHGHDLMPHIETYVGVLNSLIPRENTGAEERRMLAVIYPVWMEHIQSQPMKNSRYMYMVGHLVACSMMEQAQHVINTCYKRKFIDNQDVNAIGATDLYDFGICVLYFDPQNEDKIYHGYERMGDFVAHHLHEIAQMEESQGPWDIYVAYAGTLSTPASKKGLLEKTQGSDSVERWIAKKILACNAVLEGNRKTRIGEIDTSLQSGRLNGDQRAELHMTRAFLVELEYWGQMRMVGIDDVRKAVVAAESPDVAWLAVNMLASRYMAVHDYTTAQSILASMAGRFENTPVNDQLVKKVDRVNVMAARHRQVEARQATQVVQTKNSGMLKHVEGLIAKAVENGESPQKIESLRRMHHSLENDAGAGR